MSLLDWNKFNSHPGSRSKNFETLCRGLMRCHYERFGQFKARSNQPGVEFHLELSTACRLGSPSQWLGWQCKYYQLTLNGSLPASAKDDILSSLSMTKKILPGITDWFLWTPYTLSKKDQEWFYNLSTCMRLSLWAEEEIYNHFNGDGLLLKSTYFGELVLTPGDLEEQHRIAIQPIKDRWLSLVHQSVDAERTIRRMLGEPAPWGQLAEVGENLKDAEHRISECLDCAESEISLVVTPLLNACSTFSETLLLFHKTLSTEGIDIDVIRQKLRESKTLIDKDVVVTLRRLRLRNLPIAIVATNALADMRLAQKLLDEVEDLLEVELVAVLADAGGGKTQMAAQLTAQQADRPAGIFLQGRALHRGQTLNDLASQFSIHGNPVPSMEKLLAALDAAAKRASCRLPLVIDGLNEAENPKDWKVHLASLKETVKKYPNILIVCTLRTGERPRKRQGLPHGLENNNRESFAVMSLPEDARRIESSGFGGDVHEAIKKYFNYFKINGRDTDIPVDLLQHPLTLRIFCEVTNPTPTSEVKVDYFPASLSPLFEKYIINACARISQLNNLSHSYIAPDVEHAIYKLGIALWENKQREIGESTYRSLVGDTGREWNSSIVNLLAQEGIIFKNPGLEPDEYVITPESAPITPPSAPRLRGRPSGLRLRRACRRARR